MPLPADDSASLAERRLRNVDEFLAGRGLDRASLGRLLTQRLGAARHLLLTSSPVHGLANSTSDIDFIRVQAEDLTGPRVATQVFEADQHLEAISYSEQEVAAALAALAALAAEPPAAIVQGYRAWDKSHGLRRKYLERLVNGVALDGTSPYLDSLAPLGRVWRWASLQAATEQALFTVLAQRAGEQRGRVGYAVSTVLYLMDAMLSSRGDVYSNRKWYLLRWRNFLASGPALDGPEAELAKGIERLRGQLFAALARPGADVAGDCLELLEAAYAALGEGQPPLLRLEPAGRPGGDFLPGSRLLLGGPAIFLGGALPPGGLVRVEPGLDLPGEPGDLLRAARAGALSVRLA